ncbi:MAG TPA: YfbK domain-containing protein, partial [Longimicrobiales bacterium]|nr:YfbK domain-containing protein [Longimicrobiales bacterium]
VALYEVVPAGMAVPGGPEVDPLRYSDRAEPTGVDTEVAFVKLRYKEPDGDVSRLLTQPVMDRPVEASGETRWAAAVAGFGMLLRESPYADDFSWADVMELARGARGDDPNGYRGEFLRLVEIAGTLPVPTDDEPGAR